MRWQIAGCLVVTLASGATAGAGPMAQTPVGETATAPPGPPSLSLTLQDAIALARRNNPGLQIAEETRQRAEDRRRETDAQRLPQIALSGSYTLQGPKQEFTFEQPGQPPRRVQLSRTTTRQVGATATLNTDLAGRIRAQQRIARLGTQVAENDLRASENDLVFAVTQAYAAVLRTEALVRVQQEAVGAAREQLRVAEAKFRAGVVPQFDVIRASVQVENLRQDQLVAENTHAIALANLINLLNIDPLTRLELAPLLTAAGPGAPETGRSEREPRMQPAPTGAAARTAPGSGLPTRSVGHGALPVPPTVTPEPRILTENLAPELGPLLQEAYRQRPEIRAAQQNVRAAQERVRFERRARTPDLAIQAQVNHNPDVIGFASEKTTYSVVGLLTLSVFDGGLINARVRQAQNEAEIARARLEQLRQEIAVEVGTRLFNLREAEARQATAAANVTQAREALRIARVRYEAGVATSVEVTDAEVALTQAQTNQVNAEYDVIVAQAALRRALGRKGTAAPVCSLPTDNGGRE